jgi:hypothetical protein
VLAILVVASGACRGRVHPEAPAPLPLPAIRFAEGAAPRTFGVLFQAAWDRPRDIQARSAELNASGELLDRVAAGQRRWWLAAGPGKPSSGKTSMLLPAETSWLLEGTSLDGLSADVMWGHFGPDHNPIVPLTGPGLEAFFAAAERGLRPGDTLVLASTGPGQSESRDPLRHGIPMWGEQKAFTVEDLARALDRLPGVRVMLRLSHCDAGAFARLPALVKNPAMVCGTVAARDPAGGACASETGAQAELVGHARAIDSGLHAGLSLAEAHDRALEADDLDEVPLLTSQSFAWQRMLAAAHAARRSPDALAGEWLARAWDHPEQHRREADALARLAARFGLSDPRTLGELDEPAYKLRDLGDAAISLDDAWSQALAGLNRTQLRRLFEARPGLRTRDTSRFEVLSIAERQAILRETLDALAAQVRGEGERWRLLSAAVERRRSARAATGRILARRAAVERMRRLLRTVAAQEYLARAGTDEERATLGALLACEGWRPIERPESIPAPGRLGGLEGDWQAARALAPGRLGLGLGPVSWFERRRHHLPEGALEVTSVGDRQPAWTAGLRQHDIVTGLRGVPLDAPEDLPSWVRLAPVGSPLPVRIHRGGRGEEVTLVPERDATALPGVTALGPGSQAPLPSGVPCEEEDMGEGEKLEPKEGQPVVLFFWRTSCPSCLEALEPLMLTSLRLGAVPIAVTADPPDLVSRLLEARQRTFVFPSLCGAEATVRAYRAGAPTFVLVGANHRILDRSDGFLSGQPIFSEE